MAENQQSKPMITDVFVAGARKGWTLATTSTLPNVLMAFVVIKVLELTGLLKLIGFARRSQGLILARGNPLRLQRLQGMLDHARPGVRFVNRAPGTRTPLVLDYFLGEPRPPPPPTHG